MPFWSSFLARRRRASDDAPLVAVAPHPTRLLRALGRRSRSSPDLHPAGPSPGGEVKMVLAMRGDKRMGTGKVAAQAAHGALALYRAACEGRRSALCRDWDAGGGKKVVVSVQGADGVTRIVQAAQKARVSYSVVRDAGRTQVKRGTVTGVAVFGRAEAVDKVTGALKLF